LDMIPMYIEISAAQLQDSLEQLKMLCAKHTSPLKMNLRQAY